MMKSRVGKAPISAAILATRPPYSALPAEWNQAISAWTSSPENQDEGFHI
jgi:hypothetical protein